MSGIGLSGGTTYTFNSQANGENSPKRFKSLGLFYTLNTKTKRFRQ